MEFRVNRRTLLLIAGCVWIIAGINILRIGIITWLNDAHYWLFKVGELSLIHIWDMWYNYHRKGLDEMAANPDRGRTTIIGLLPVLEQVKSARPTSPLLQMFADSKLDEVVLIYSKATTQEKQEGCLLYTSSGISIF